MASHRFPSAYLFLKEIEESLALDRVSISLASTSEIVAIIFGYESFQKLLEDENFDNENLSNVQYLYYDDSEIAERLEQVVLDEDSDNEDLTSERIFDHLRMVLEELPYDFVSLDELKRKSVEFCENDSYSFLDEEGVSGAIADSDTIYDEVYIEGAVSAEFDDGFKSVIHASASGTHRKESDISGRDMSLSIEVTSSVKVGKYGLGQLEVEAVNGGLVDHWDEEHTS